MKKIVFTMGLWLVFGYANAQDLVQTIRGKVQDEASGAPIIGANIVVLDSDPLLGAATDINGNYVIPGVPVGRISLKISAIGFEEVRLSEVLVNSAKENVLLIKLREALADLDEIVITAENERGRPLNELATVSARSFTVEDAKNYAASVNDPSRAALSFAGVTTSDDENNAIIIRGNSPRNILWRIEGIEVPNPNHFSSDNSGGGGISILSVNVLDNSDFFTGAFPAEYGNGTSGVFDLKLRSGNSFKREYAFQAGLLGLDFAAEGPFKKNSGKASYLVNYRYSTLGILDALGIVTDFADVIPVFQDLSFKIHLPSAKAGTFDIWGLGGLSEQKDDDPLFPETFGSDLGVAGLNHTIFLGKNTYLESGLVYSYQLLSSDEQDLEIQETFEDRFVNQTLRGRIQLNHKFNARLSLRTGLIGAYLSYNIFERFTNPIETSTTLDQDGQTGLWQAYAQGQYRLSPQLNLNLGLHALYFSLNSSHSIEPRVGLQWKVGPKTSLSFGYGRHSRVESLSVYFARIQDGEGLESLPNQDLELAKADHYVLAYDQFFGKHWHLKLEVYYQYLRDVPIARADRTSAFEQVFSTINLDNSFVNIPLVNEGRGENYGLELTLEKFFTKGWYLLMTNSLFDAEFTARDGIARDSRFNFDFATTFLGGKEFKVGKEKQNSIGLNGRLLWNGGPRFFPFDLEASQQSGFGVLDFSQGYALKAPSYFRFDFRINFRWNRPKFASIISLDIQNLSNRSNVFDYFYSTRSNQVVASEQLGLVPVLNYRMEF